MFPTSQVFGVWSQVISVTIVSRQIMKVANERINVSPTALCVKILCLYVLKSEIEIPVFQTKIALEKTSWCVT